MLLNIFQVSDAGVGLVGLHFSRKNKLPSYSLSVCRSDVILAKPPYLEKISDIIFLLDLVRSPV